MIWNFHSLWSSLSLEMLYALEIYFNIDINIVMPVLGGGEGEKSIWVTLSFSIFDLQPDSHD